MSSVSEKIAAAKAAPLPSVVVTIALTDTLAARREQLAESLEAAKKSRAKGKAEAAAKVQAELDSLLADEAGSLIDLKFTKLPGDKWAELTARAPARLGVPIDMQYGYNIHQAVKIAAPLSGVSVEAGEEVPLKVIAADPDNGIAAVDEWADLFAAAAGYEFTRIVDAIYNLNEYAPAARIDRLKKARTAMTASGSTSG